MTTSLGIFLWYDRRFVIKNEKNFFGVSLILFWTGQSKYNRKSQKFALAADTHAYVKNNNNHYVIQILLNL